MSYNQELCNAKYLCYEQAYIVSTLRKSPGSAVASNAQTQEFLEELMR